MPPTSETQRSGWVGSGRYFDALLAATVLLLPAWSLSFANNAAATIYALALASAVGALLSFRWADCDRHRWRRPSTLVAVAVAAFTVVGFAANASGAGALLTGAGLVGAGLSLAIGTFDRDQLARRIVVPLSITFVLQAVLATAQLALQRPLGIAWLTGVDQLSTIDGVTRPQGLFDHPYEMVVFALLAISLALVCSYPERWQWLRWLTVLSGGVTIAITYSRAGAIAFILLLAVAAVVLRSDRTARALVTSSLAAGVVVAVVASSGWTARVDHTTGDSLDEISHGRIQQLEDAWMLVQEHPVFGVGPRLTQWVLEARYPNRTQIFPVHNVPILITVELGIVAGLVVFGLLVAVGVAVVRNRGPALVVFVSLVPFLLVDHLLYSIPIGLLMWAIWGASITVLLSTSSSGEQPDTLAATN